jgi:hypothetical protein
MEFLREAFKGGNRFLVGVALTGPPRCERGASTTSRTALDDAAEALGQRDGESTTSGRRSASPRRWCPGG